MSQQRIYRQVLQRIKQAEQQSEQPIKQLQLDSIQIRQITKQIKNLIESYPQISYLTLNDCQLTSLSNFPKLPNLTILQLSNNNIQDDELFNLLKNSGISHLMIDQNRLKSIQKVSILRQLPNLQQLQLGNNLIGDSDFYRQQIFQRIPQIKIIDCKDRYGNIAINSQSEQQQLQENQNSMIEIKSYSKPSSSSDKIELKQTNSKNKNSTNQQLLSFLNHQSQQNQSSNQSQQISQQSQDQNNNNKIQQEQHSSKDQSKQNHQSTQKYPRKIIKHNQTHNQYQNQN